MTLDAAWRRIRSNARAPSASPKTKRSTGDFEISSSRELGIISRQIREVRFRFLPQEGLPIRRPEKTPRPIVIAPVRNRVVQRAILNVLQNDPRIYVRLNTRHSFGGLQGRGVIDAMREVARAIGDGHVYFYRSDIRDFFTGIPRSRVVGDVGRIVRDAKLRALFAAGLETNLANLNELSPEEQALFPDSTGGVAQGSPLSAFAGNLLLGDLDARANAGDARFIRYIDDLLILGKSPEHARACFDFVRSELTALGFSVYAVGQSNGKAAAGHVRKSFVFLGTQVSGGILQPARHNRAAFLERAEGIVEQGRRQLVAISKREPAGLHGGLAKTLWQLDSQVRGTGRAFQHCDCPQLWSDLDRKLDDMIAGLLGVYRRLQAKESSPTKRRRLLGITPLIDLNGIPWRQLVQGPIATDSESGS